MIDVGLEVTFGKVHKQTGRWIKQSLYLNFQSKEQRDAVYDKVEKYLPGQARTEQTPIGEYT